MTTHQSHSLGKTILLSGLLVGFLDGLAAAAITYFMSGRSPISVYQYIASGIFGKAAFSGGLGMGLLGVLLHFIIAFSFTVLFFQLYPKLKFLSKNFLLSGILYGIFVCLVMNLGVLPLTQVNQPPFKPLSVFIGITTLIVMIGIPLSWIASRYYSKPE